MVQAVILAAGEGSRIRPLTWSRPKAMIPVANVPIIGHVINSLVENGIRSIIVVVGYRREQVMNYLATLEIPIQVVVQDKQLGTAHALQCAESNVKEDFIVLPGDNWINPGSIAKIKGERNAMLVKEHERPTNFGVVEIENGNVTRIVEKPAIAPTMTVSTGVLSLTKRFFEHIETTEIPDALTLMIERGECIKAIPADDWQDAIVPWDLLAMNAHLLKQISSRYEGTVSRNAIIKGSVRIGVGTIIHPYTVILGPVIIGDNCEIGPHVSLMPYTSIGSRVRVESHSHIAGSLIMDDTLIGPHSTIRDTVIAEGCAFEDHISTWPSETLFDIHGEIWKAEFGAVIGDRVRAGPFTTLNNCIVGNNVKIQGGRMITSIIPDGTSVL
ncbi:MAG: NTP transferase domain-containing protein [Methanomicrobiales archaeon]|nr:NTP transferase domain-containing protein [Methanomicrobiales archaeon]